MMSKRREQSRELMRRMREERKREGERSGRVRLGFNDIYVKPETREKIRDLIEADERSAATEVSASIFWEDY